jgi:hypothetical protein
MAEPVEPVVEPSIANESTPVPWTLFKWYDMGNFSLNWGFFLSNTDWFIYLFIILKLV